MTAAQPAQVIENETTSAGAHLTVVPQSGEEAFLSASEILERPALSDEDEADIGKRKAYYASRTWALHQFVDAFVGLSTQDQDYVMDVLTEAFEAPQGLPKTVFDKVVNGAFGRLTDQVNFLRANKTINEHGTSPSTDHMKMCDGALHRLIEMFGRSPDFVQEQIADIVKGMFLTKNIRPGVLRAIETKAARLNFETAVKAVHQAESRAKFAEAARKREERRENDRIVRAGMQTSNGGGSGGKTPKKSKKK